MADQVPAVCDVLDTIERRNWGRLRRLLHPEVHWTTAVEEHLHTPAYHEVRDGLIVRWIDTPG